jgi:hypothetical protein
VDTLEELADTALKSGQKMAQFCQRRTGDLGLFGDCFNDGLGANLAEALA